MPLSILIVEDEPMNAEVLKVVLEAEGHRVAVASTAQSGLDLASEVQPDIVFMDIVLPGGMDGIEATRRLKENPEFSGRIVCQSARCTEGDQQQCLAAGADAYMAKPFRRSDVLAMVARYDAEGD